MNDGLMRLLDVADVLDEVPEDKFDMGIWFRSCGTVGCAIGWYIEKRRPANLKIGDGVYSVEPQLDTQDVDGILGGFFGLSRYFGVEPSDTIYLFNRPDYRGDSDRHVSRSEVQSRIRVFVASKLPPKTYRVLRPVTAPAEVLALCC